MTGRLRHSLPQYLKACGYDTTMVYPTDADFAGTRQFYLSIGFDRVIDADVHQAPDGRQRDAFYLDLVARQLSAVPADGRRRPQFVVASSMASHGPWDFPFQPEATAEQPRWNADAEIDEYLRRLLIAKRDHAAFRQRMRQEMPARRILYVDYGDHQPSLAAMPLKQATAIADGGKSWQMGPGVRGFETFYAVSAQGFMPVWPSRTIPILEAAHLPIVHDHGRRPAAGPGDGAARQAPEGVQRPLQHLRGCRSGRALPALACRFRLDRGALTQRSGRESA